MKNSKEGGLLGWLKRLFVKPPPPVPWAMLGEKAVAKPEGGYVIKLGELGEIYVGEPEPAKPKRPALAPEAKKKAEAKKAFFAEHWVLHGAKAGWWMWAIAEWKAFVEAEGMAAEYPGIAYLEGHPEDEAKVMKALMAVHAAIEIKWPEIPKIAAMVKEGMEAEAIVAAHVAKKAKAKAAYAKKKAKEEAEVEAWWALPDEVKHGMIEAANVVHAAREKEKAAA